MSINKEKIKGVEKMNQRRLCRWLRFVMMGIGICGLGVYLGIIPSYGRDMAEANPEYANCFWPWLLFLWGTALPCFGSLICGWKIAGEIGKDNSFSRKNAGLMEKIAYLAAIDTVYFFIGNVIFTLMGKNHPGILILAIIITFGGFAVTIAAAGLSHLILNAAELKEESDLTI